MPPPWTSANQSPCPQYIRTSDSASVKYPNLLGRKATYSGHRRTTTQQLVRSSLQALSLINSGLICPHFFIVCSGEIRTEIRITSLDSKIPILFRLSISVLERNAGLFITNSDQLMTNFYGVDPWRRAGCYFSLIISLMASILPAIS